METIKFRNEEISCMYGWSDDDTFEWKSFSITMDI